MEETAGAGRALSRHSQRKAGETTCRKCDSPHQYFLGKISKCFTMAHTALTVLYAGQGKTGGCESDDDAHMGDDPEQRAQIATAQQTKL